MEIMENLEESGVIPARPVPKKYIPAILYLAENMSKADKEIASSERVIINELADAAKIKDFRHTKDYQALNESKAIEALEVDLARLATLVVISLVLKSDSKRKHTEHDYFTRIREKMNMAPITVPLGFEAHKSLALKYFSR